jgi:hypothetical protein
MNMTNVALGKIGAPEHTSLLVIQLVCVLMSHYYDSNVRSILPPLQNTLINVNHTLLQFGDDRNQRGVSHDGEKNHVTKISVQSVSDTASVQSVFDTASDLVHGRDMNGMNKTFGTIVFPYMHEWFGPIDTMDEQWYYKIGWQNLENLLCWNEETENIENYGG